MKAAELSRDADSLFPVAVGTTSVGNVLMITAYSDDYSIGTLCEKVNRTYAEKHGYEFISEVLPLDVISEIIAPKKHCTWYKIALLKKLFADVSYLESKRIRYILWIDADAIAVDHEVRFADIIERCNQRDLIIAEDMNAGCLINAGVFMLRTTGWSRDFINDVWDCVKYDDVTFYEQSAMIRVLRSKKEDLDSVSPFHSYLPNAVQGVKLFPHTAVLPLSDFNSNRGMLCNDIRDFEDFVRSVCEDTATSAPNTVSDGESAGATATVTAADTTTDTTTESVKDIIAVNAHSSHTALTRSDASSGMNPRRGVSKKLSVPNLCYQASGSFCSLCQRTVGTNRKCVAAAAANYNPSLFVFHPAGMPDKLNLLLTALHKYKVPYDLAGAIRKSLLPRSSVVADGVSDTAMTPAPLRLVRRNRLRTIRHHLIESSADPGASRRAGSRA